NILFQRMRLLAKKDIGVIFITHIISEILEICDSVTILRNGELITVEEVKNLDLEKIVKLILGRSAEKSSHEKPLPSEKIIFSVKNLSSRDNALKDINLELKNGEILGIYGLRDQGQTVLLETIFGANKKRTGDLAL
ncbi:MAG: D-xylose ABC transporter ATP-binding protein, partial [Actinobacteria bacterium]|nr:D-xylose ABC transporter ATP-binding protein [Actinomycetota bacterium]